VIERICVNAGLVGARNQVEGIVKVKSLSGEDVYAGLLDQRDGRFRSCGHCLNQDLQDSGFSGQDNPANLKIL
jgi:hypothetical protein